MSMQNLDINSSIIKSSNDKDNKLHEIARLRAEHFSSLLTFTRTFFKLRTGRTFDLSDPPGRESHYITISRALERALNGECNRLIINVPPRYGKTELVIHFIAWAMARYPDSNFLYVSYSHSLAKKQTQTIRDIISLSYFKSLFSVSIKDDSSAKDNFQTNNNGSVYAAGAQGTITGFGAGIKSCDRFGGCIVIDDIIKPEEATSDTVREGINEWYFNTLQSRLNTQNTPIIFIGQKVHEHDLAQVLIENGGWEVVSLPAIDEANNALHPQMHDLKTLLKMKQESPYNFAAQYQQRPLPAGGGIFKENWFIKLEEEPAIEATFITVDTAETSKDYNDASVFSFWGLYKLTNFEIDVDIFGLHWIDCLEIRIEPKDLQAEFLSFWRKCMSHTVKPYAAAIEKKTTGVTLISTLKDMQGLQIIDLERTRASGNKTSRYLEMQPYVSSNRISLPTYGFHTNHCIDHMQKITANDSHRFDDIADTAYDAVKLALIDKVISRKVKNDYSDIGKLFKLNATKVNRLKYNAYRR